LLCVGFAFPDGAFLAAGGVFHFVLAESKVGLKFGGPCVGQIVADKLESGASFFSGGLYTVKERG
jgi:hypothetical protein